MSFVGVRRGGELDLPSHGIGIMASGSLRVGEGSKKSTLRLLVSTIKA